MTLTGILCPKVQQVADKWTSHRQLDMPPELAEIAVAKQCRDAQESKS